MPIARPRTRKIATTTTTKASKSVKPAKTLKSTPKKSGATRVKKTEKKATDKAKPNPKKEVKKPKPKVLREHAPGIRVCDDVPVFECCPVKGPMVSVLADDVGSSAYSVMLQYDDTHNHHKYYAMQALRLPDAKFGCLFWWGRTGYPGRKALVKSYDKKNIIKTFCTKFHSKSGLDWADRNLGAVHGKYRIVTADQFGKSPSPEEKMESQEEQQATHAKSRLPEELKSFLELITDRKMFAAGIKQIEEHYDNSEEMPIGKLTPGQLEKGYECLRKIEAEMAKELPCKLSLQEASDCFYEHIPHNFGDQGPPVIDNSDLIKDKALLLNTLAEVQIALRRMEEAEATEANGMTNHIDALYKAEKLKLEVVQPDSEEYKVIDQYLNMNHSPAHEFDMSMVTLLKVKNPKEAPYYKDLGNKMLLWHGSRLPAVFGVLAHELQVARPETPNDQKASGFMFGRGLYFADASSESAVYCHIPHSGDGVLMLAEVSLGNPLEKAGPDFNARDLPEGKDSVIGKGRKAPECEEFDDEEGYKIMVDDVRVPIGPLKKVPGRKGKLQLNEYTVYHPNQARIRYFVRVHFDRSTK
ncbi:unnamed protein product, partial [Mesorhabditis spiculigera]